MIGAKLRVLLSADQLCCDLSVCPCRNLLRREFVYRTKGVVSQIASLPPQVDYAKHLSHHPTPHNAVCSTNNKTYVLNRDVLYIALQGRPELLPRKDRGSTASCMQASGSYLSNCAVAHVQLAVGHHLRSYDHSQRHAAPRPPKRKPRGTTSRNAYTTALVSALVHPKRVTQSGRGRTKDAGSSSYVLLSQA